MPPKRTPRRKKQPRKVTKRSTQRKRQRGTASTRSPKAHAATMDAVSERLDMMLPEVMARIAAVEHVLIEKRICSHEDLVEARKFIDEQESF